MSDTPYKTTNSKTVYQNPWIRVREDEIIRPDGSAGIYGVIESRDSVMVAAIDDQQRILIINAFSYPGQKWHWELPAGGTDGEDYVEASKRELLEETGVLANSWQLIGTARVCDGLMTEKMAILLATDIKHTDKPVADDDGVIRNSKFVDLDTIYEMVQSGEIDEGQTLTVLYLVERYLRNKSS